MSDAASCRCRARQLDAVAPLVNAGLVRMLQMRCAKKERLLVGTVALSSNKNTALLVGSAVRWESEYNNASGSFFSDRGQAARIELLIADQVFMKSDAIAFFEIGCRRDWGRSGRPMRHRTCKKIRNWAV